MDLTDFSRLARNDEVWDHIREETLRLSALPIAGSEEREWAAAKPTRKMLLEMVSIHDGMERLVSLAERETLDENPVLNNWLTSIRGLSRRMERSLERVGVKAVPSLGRPFDPNLHEVMEVRKAPELPPTTVVEVVEKAYRWGDRLLRIGKVIVTPKKKVISTSRSE